MKAGVRVNRAELLWRLLVLALGFVFAQPGHPQVLVGASPAIQSAQRQFQSGDFSGAITTLRSYLMQAPSDAQAQYWEGRNYYELRDFDRAISTIERATQIDPQNSDYHDWLGRAYGRKAEKEHSYFLARRVKKEFEDAVRLDDRNLTARRDLEEYCIQAPWIIGGSIEEARGQADEISTIQPVAGYLARASFYFESLKKPEQARNEYRLLLDAKPRVVDPYLEAADFFITEKDLSSLAAFIDAASKINPTDPRLAYYRGVEEIEGAHDLGEAEQYLKSYLASTPDRSEWPSHASAREWLGQLYETQGKSGEAAEQYRAALELDPARKEARVRLERLEKAAY